MNELNEWARNADGHMISIIFIIVYFSTLVFILYPDLRNFLEKNKFE